MGKNGVVSISQRAGVWCKPGEEDAWAAPDAARRNPFLKGE